MQSKHIQMNLLPNLVLLTVLRLIGWDLCVVYVKMCVSICILYKKKVLLGTDNVLLGILSVCIDLVAEIINKCEYNVANLCYLTLRLCHQMKSKQLFILEVSRFHTRKKIKHFWTKILQERAHFSSNWH